MSNEKALAVRGTAIVPTDIGGFADLADRFAKSNMIPGDLRAKPDDVFVTLLAGHELGLTPMASLRAIHVVKGKPILSADTMVALVLGRGAAEYFIPIAEESNETQAVYETKRAGSPVAQRQKWTIKDAERAGLLTNDNWKKYPSAMLKARCKAVLARDVYPDILAGCYEESERDDVERDAGPTRIPTRPVAVHEPDAGSVLDAEFTEAPDAWSPFLLAIEPVLKDDTSGWPVDMAIREIKAALDGCPNKVALNEVMHPILGALDKAGADPRIAEVRAAIGDHYKARSASFKGKAA